MPIESKIRTGRSASDTSPAAWTNGRRPGELEEGWVDEIVHRFFRVLNTHLIKLERASQHSDGSEEPPLPKNPKEPQPEPDLDAMLKRAELRASNVRTLERLERMLNRLIAVETARALLRHSQMVTVNDQARVAVINEYNRLVGPDKQVPLLPQSDE